MQNFKRFIKDKTGENLVAWCKNIIEGETEHIQRFTKGILNDYHAVYQGFESNLSNGPVSRRSSQQAQNNKATDVWASKL